MVDGARPGKQRNACDWLENVAVPTSMNEDKVTWPLDVELDRGTMKVSS